MGALTQWVKENSKYLKLEDGDSVTATFQGFSFEKSSFDSEKQVVRYILETSDGLKSWETSAKSVAEFFDRVEPGKRVTITRLGTGANTRFKLNFAE